MDRDTAVQQPLLATTWIRGYERCWKRMDASS
jgi:hypothetical protein